MHKLLFTAWHEVPRVKENLVVVMVVMVVIVGKVPQVTFEHRGCLVYASGGTLGVHC